MKIVLASVLHSPLLSLLFHLFTYFRLGPNSVDVEPGHAPTGNYLSSLEIGEACSPGSMTGFAIVNCEADDPSYAMVDSGHLFFLLGREDFLGPNAGGERKGNRAVFLALHLKLGVSERILF